MNKTAKRSIAIVSLSVLTSMTAYAANPGTYLGLGLGAGKQGTSNLDLSNNRGINFDQSRTTNGLAGRVFAGYNFNEYFGLETGLTQYSNAKTKFYSNNTVGGTLDGSAEYKMAAFDVVGKGYLPLSDGFNLYGLGGFALVNSKVKGQAAVTQTGANAPLFSASGSSTHSAVRPVVGLGASYDLPQTPWTTSLEYSHTFGKGNVKSSSSAIPSASLMTLNIAYNLG